MNNLSAVESIYFAALQKGTPEERAAYLDEACGPDAELRRHVERLLSAQAKAGGFLEGPAPGLVATADEPRGADAATLGERPGSGIGPDQPLQQIGGGRQ